MTRRGVISGFLLAVIAGLLVSLFLVLGSRDDSLRTASRNACIQVEELRTVLRGVLVRGELTINRNPNLTVSQKVQAHLFYRQAIADLAAHDCG